MVGDAKDGDAADPVVAGVPLSRYVAVYAATSEGFPLEDVLVHEGLDPACWPSVDTAWAREMLKSAEGDLALIDEHDRRLLEAQERFRRRVTPLDDDLRAWLDFYRIWTADPEPLVRLAAWKLGRNDVLRIHRRWGERMDQDGTLRAQAFTILQEPPGDLPALDMDPSRLPPSLVAPVPVASRPAAVPKEASSDPPWPGLDVDLPTTEVVKAPANLPRIAAPAPPMGIARPPRVTVEMGALPPGLLAAALPFMEVKESGPPPGRAVDSDPPAPVLPLATPPARRPESIGPTLMLAQYASLCAELAVFPAMSEQTFARYGLEAAHDRIAVDRAWQARLQSSPAEYQEWHRLFQHYHAYLSGRAGR